jgi:maltose O-acetyltransferase
MGEFPVFHFSQNLSQTQNFPTIHYPLLSSQNHIVNFTHKATLNYSLLKLAQMNRQGKLQKHGHSVKNIPYSTRIGSKMTTSRPLSTHPADQNSPQDPPLSTHNKSSIKIHIINGQPKAKLSQRDLMTMGLEFNVRDPDLAQARTRSKTLSLQLSQLPIPYNKEEKRVYNQVLRQLLPQMHKSAYIIGPITVDYGFNIHIGQNAFLNSNCTLLDVAPIHIGNNTMVGPNVDFYTASHGVDFMKRREGYTIGKEIIIGDDVWIGGKSVILPGVRIGNRSIIGAGSVVTKDVPDDVFVAGNPAVVKKILVNNEGDYDQNVANLFKSGNGIDVV